jgi:hypothetical protein
MSIQNMINNFDKGLWPYESTSIISDLPNPIERSSIARFADRVGRIPLLGTPVGAARMISSLVIGIFASLSILVSIVCRQNNLVDKYSFVAGRSFDEFVRGVGELFPFLIIWTDYQRARVEKEGIIHSNDGAYGQYIYKVDGWRYYSKNRYEGQLEWRCREKNTIAQSVYGKILPKTISL